MARVVIGLGNRFVHDDAAGLRVVQELRKRGHFDGQGGVVLKEYEEMDLSLLQEFEDASGLVLVDSVRSGAKPGSVSLFEVPEEAGAVDALPSLHELELSDMIRLARKIGVVRCPVVIVGIEPADLSLGEGLSKEVEAAIPEAVRAVLAQVGAEPTSVSGPSLTVILVDQSASMGREWADYGIPMAEGVANVLNLYLQKVTQKRDADRKTGASEFDSGNFGIAVIGYGREEGVAERVFYMDAGETWADERLTRSQTSTTSSDDSLSTFSVWINPVVGAARAPLRRALAAASMMLGPWVASHKLAPPPQVINITDGSLDGDPREEAEGLRGVSTLNGHAVLWTCHLAPGPDAEPILFPTEEASLGRPVDPEKASLFRCASEFPQDNVPNLMMEFPEVSRIRGGRACVFDADLRTLVRFVSFVTRVPLP